jgi:hypothetical protein
MPDDDRPKLTDRQARCVIIAAERLGFEREPDRYEVWYDHDLHDDARDAADYLSEHDPEALAGALIAEEPIPPDRAAYRITETGRFSSADAAVVIGAATERGFTPPPRELAQLDWQVTWMQATASVAFLWEHHPSVLRELIGELAQLAPPAPYARSPREPL